MKELKNIPTAQLVEELSGREETFECFMTDENTAGVLIPHKKINEILPVGSAVIIVRGPLNREHD